MHRVDKAGARPKTAAMASPTEPPREPSPEPPRQSADSPATPNVLRLVREGHEGRVLGVLRAHGALSRAELGRRTQLSRATLSSIVQRMLAQDAVVELPADGAVSRGRPATRISLNPKGGLAIGMDLGHQRIQVAIANVGHEIIGVDARRCAERTPWAKRLQIAGDLVESLAARTTTSLTSLDGIGVGVVGPVLATGQERARTHRLAMIRDGLGERFAAPVHIDNNTRLAALAEAIWGAGAGINDVCYLRLSHGVGGGLVLRGQLFSGAGAAGEFGHVCVDPDGPPCHCGGRGCLERYVALDTVLQRSGCASVDELLSRLSAGDPDVGAVIDEVGRWTGRVVAAACNLVHPEVVVVGGELSAAGDALVRPIMDGVRMFAHRQVRRGLHVRAATLGPGGAAQGGIALVLRESALLSDYLGLAASPAEPS